jgi:hypothetical protein
MLGPQSFSVLPIVINNDNFKFNNDFKSHITIKKI